MKISARFVVPALALLLVSPSALPAAGEGEPPVLVYAATGLSAALKKIGAAFQKKTGTPVELTFGGSLALSRQILQGARPDVFVPEGGGVMVPLLRVALVDEDSSFLFANNSLVAAAPATGAAPLASPGEMAGGKFRRVAIADPDVIPAGIQAKRSLMVLDLWGRMQDRVRVFPDVKGALAAVESGEADLGIFYVTDVKENTRVRTILTLPQSSYEPIRYVAALVARPGAPAAARPFLEFLRGPEARRAIQDAGLTPPSP
jgi:molybdate transport system substrate-binding protein